MISLNNLTKKYGETLAVNGISFEIKKGEIVGLLGPNGAGKSTTIRMITCYLNPTSGSAKVAGYDIEKDTRKIKKIIGYLPESAPLYMDMVVYDYLAYIARIQEVQEKDIEERIKYVVKTCSLENVVSKTIGDLSKGYKQRVGIASAIVHNPEILILDEPTNGLDPNQIVEIRELIRELGKEKTVVLSTHILSEAELACDRVIIINKGEVIADSPTKDIALGKDKNIFISLVIRTKENNEILKRLFMNLNDVDKIEIRDNNDIKDILISSKADIREAIYKAVKQTDWLLLEMKINKEDLESVFQALTRES